MQNFLSIMVLQAMKVGFHLFLPEEFTKSRSKALYEMVSEKSLDVKVVTTDSEGVQVVEIFDAADDLENRTSFNIQLYQR